MAEHIHVAPDQLREAAGHHQEAADYLRTMPGTHEAIQESLDSLGPIFSELREAGRELLEQRRLCYEQQADDHAEMAQNLKLSADLWEEQDSQAAGQLGGIVDDGR
jgi:hypothetical protein